VSQTQATYRAIQAVAPGRLELVENHWSHRPRVTSAFASRRAASAIRTRQPSRGSFRSSGHACPGMR
jgi:hypothetical protein